MKQKIKDTSTRKDEFGITKGEWMSRNVHTRDVIKIESPNGLPICSIDVINAPSSKSDAQAICTAVNSTYGKNLNPAAMEELYKAATMALDNMENGEAHTKYRYTTVVHALQAALKNAKL